MGGIVQLVDYLEDISKGTIHHPLDGRVSLVRVKKVQKGALLLHIPILRYWRY